MSAWDMPALLSREECLPLGECDFCGKEAICECCDYRCRKAVCDDCSVPALDADQSLGQIRRCDECDEKTPNIRVILTQRDVVSMLQDALSHLAADDEMLWDYELCYAEIHDLILKVRHEEAA